MPLHTHTRQCLPACQRRGGISVLSELRLKVVITSRVWKFRSHCLSPKCGWEGPLRGGEKRQHRESRCVKVGRCPRWGDRKWESRKGNLISRFCSSLGSLGVYSLRNGKLWNAVEQGRSTRSINEEYQSGGNRQRARKEQIAGRGPVEETTSEVQRCSREKNSRVK